jgi:ubiquinone/menaquinone biosynthesis C-methylase UbiE
MLVYLLLICIILSILFYFKKHEKKINPKIIYNTNSDLYDKEYAKIYDNITYDYSRVQQDINALLPTITDTTTVLDIGSGTGLYVHELNEQGIKAIGLDKSNDMVHYSKKYKHKYVQGNALYMTTFHNESFSHITCLYYTLYYIKNKDQLFYNIYNWLEPEGLFFLHLTNKISYGVPNISSSDFTYTRKIKENKVYETIKTKDKIIKNEHTFYMESIPFILTIVKNAGFNVISHEKYDAYNSLYIFQKQN